MLLKVTVIGSLLGHFSVRKLPRKSCTMGNDVRHYEHISCNKGSKRTAKNCLNGRK